MEIFVGMFIGFIAGVVGLFLNLYIMEKMIKKGHLPKFLKDLGVKLPEKKP